MHRRIQRIRRTTAAAVVIGWYKPADHHLTVGNPIEIPLAPIRHRKRRIHVGVAVVSSTTGVIGNRKLNRRPDLKAPSRDRDSLAWSVVRLVSTDAGQMQHIVVMGSNQRLINGEEEVGHDLSGILALRFTSSRDQ